VRKKLLVVTSALLLWFSTGFALACLAQKNRVGGQTQPAPSLLSLLPAADAVALVNQRRLLNEVIPRIFAENPSKLAAVNAEIEQFKSRTGIDLRSFDQVALGMHYTYPSAGITKIDTVAIARGTFDPGAMVTAGRLAAGGRYQEQKYQGQTIYIFGLDQQVRLLGLFNMQIRELAVSPLDGNTLAIGKPDGVRAVIDAAKARRRANAELIALASRDSNAVFGFGGNISPALLESLKIGNDAIARELTAVRQVYGSVGTTERDLEMFMVARTVDVYSAQNLSNTIASLKQLGALFIKRLPAAKGALARSALDNLKITTQGNELQIRTTVAQADIAPLMRGF
jgi:hypothetical protein